MGLKGRHVCLKRQAHWLQWLSAVSRGYLLRPLTDSFASDNGTVTYTDRI
jgi:hypothetical protein